MSTSIRSFIGPRTAPTVRATALLAAVAVAAASCGVEVPVQGGTEADPDGTVTMTTTVPAHEPQPEPEPPAAPEPPVPVATLGELEATLPPTSGVAFAPVGRPDEVSALGTWSTGVAWSTIKVPLALAAVRAGGPASSVEPALTASDNAAAEGLWASLGDGPAASAAVGAVLAEAGDPVTVVPDVQLRPGFTVFGQAGWSTGDQARFAAGLPCLPDAAVALEPMRRVNADQRWGLGEIPGAAIKGGWGPSADGAGYLVRQFGIVPAPGGEVAVAMAVEAGDFASGTAELSRMGASVAAVLDQLPAGHC